MEEKTTYSLDTIMRFLRAYPGCLFLKDDKGCYYYTSDICDELNRVEAGGLVGKNELEVQKDPELGRQYYEEDMKLLKEGGSYQYYSEFKGENHTRYLEINKAAVPDDTGKIVGIIGTVVDVTEEIQLRKQFQTQYVTDVVTGIYNNRYLEQWLSEEKPVYPFTLIACDCNFLKHINDMFGHEYGNQLLKNAGELFLENLPEKCATVRIGGDEFLILCNDTTEEEAEHLIEILTENTQEKFVKGNRLSIAYGYQTMREGEMTFDECRDKADRHMYREKRKMKQEFFSGSGMNDPIYNEEMFRKLMSHMPVIMFFKDTECKYRYIINYNERHLKNKSETAYGIGLTDLELQRDEALGREYYEDDLKILATGEGSVLNSMVLEEGKEHYYQITKSAVYDEENKIMGIVGVVMDITATRLRLS